MENQNQHLKVTSIGEVKTAIDGRNYVVISVQQPSQPGLIVTTRPHKKVIWSHQPNSGPNSDNPEPVPYFDQIIEAMEKHGQCTIQGKMVTVETEPYFIENLSGSAQYKHPETGNPANRVTQKTYVVFPDESVDRLLANDDLTRKGEKPGVTDGLKHPDEELIAEDLGEEAEAQMS